MCRVKEARRRRKGKELKRLEWTVNYDRMTRSREFGENGEEKALILAVSLIGFFNECEG